MRLVAAIILGGKRGSHRGALLSIQSLREKNRYRAFRTNLRSMTVRPSQVDGEIEFSQWEQTAFSDTLSQKLRIQFAMHAIKGVSHPMKRTWNANDGKSGIFSLTSTLTLGVMLSVAGCDQPQTVAQKDPSQAASVSGGTQKAGGTTGDSQSQPAKIDPEYLAPDGTVDLQGKSKPPKLHLPDVIDDDKHEIPADAVFGTPTLADPQPAQMENEGAKANAEPKTANEKATASPTKPEDSTGNATEEPVVAPVEEPTPEPAQTSDAPKPATVPAQTVATTESQAPKKASGIGNLASEEELNQKIAEDWNNPQVVFVLTGQQHGYLEPCGCTGLERQKGGLIRRDTLVSQLRERGWQVVPLDVGNQVRKSFGLQPQMQFETTVRAFERMGYKAVSFGPEDLQLPSLSLIQTVGTENPKQPREFISANTAVLDRSFWPEWKVVPVGDRKIGITAYVNDPTGSLKSNRDVMFEDAEKSVKAALAKLKAEGCDYMILLAHASQEDSEKMAVAVPGFDLVVTAGGHGEPRNVLDPIEGSKALISQVGTKGMYACLVGLFDDAKQPVRYQRVALSSQFKDSQPMFEIFKEYQKRLQNVVTREGFEGLGYCHNLTHQAVNMLAAMNAAAAIRPPSKCGRNRHTSMRPIRL